MENAKLQVEEVLNPQTQDIDFLTQKINEESTNQNIQKEAFPFGFFMINKKERSLEQKFIIAGCNGSVVYGSIYTDQLWVDPQHRGKGFGKLLMEKVHELGRKNDCTFSTVGTMSFQGAQTFYEKLGYRVEFIRNGYVNEGTMIYLKKTL